MSRSFIWLLLAVAALFSGVALLGNIIAGVALPLTLAFTTSALVLTVVFIWLRSSGRARSLLLGVAVRGALIALIAVIAYDASRGVLAAIDPSPFNPYAAIPIFGALLVGREAPEGLILAFGVGFHLLNGISFGLAYAFAFGRIAVRSARWAAVTGVAWGLFLEAFQVTLYPGWLNITTYREFVTISFFGHIVYGLVLGLLGHRFLPWPRDVDDEDGDDEDPELVEAEE